jgi:hypothetical protein
MRIVMSAEKVTENSDRAPGDSTLMESDAGDVAKDPTAGDDANMSVTIPCAEKMERRRAGLFSKLENTGRCTPARAGTVMEKLLQVVTARPSKKMILNTGSVGPVQDARIDRPVCESRTGKSTKACPPNDGKESTSASPGRSDIDS